MKVRVWALASILAAVLAVDASAWSIKPGLKTRWAADVTPDNVLGEHPRPQMVRSQWMNLNGIWNIAKLTDIDDELPAKFTTEILVPFVPESPMSGLKTHYESMAYKRTFTVPEGWSGRTLIHFGAVDWIAKVYVNGQLAGQHQGGYDEFSFDITNLLTGSGEQELVVRVFDPSNHGWQPRGKQTLSPGGIFYTASSGIWQTVWLENVADAYIDRLVITPDIDRGLVEVSAIAGGSTANAKEVEVKVLKDGKPVQSATGAAGSKIAVAVPNAELWTPEHPFLYDLEVTLTDTKGGKDVVQSYFGMRKVSKKQDAKGRWMIQLNNEDVFQMGPLDQGYWPEGIYTAPTDEALMNDIVIMKRMGFNMVRKHIKVEPQRWYYWCDKLGLMVWQDFPSSNYSSSGLKDDNGNSITPQIVTDEWLDELAAMVQTHYNAPCITTWVTFNEGGGQSSNLTRLAVDKVAELDKTRLINEASGWTNYKYADFKDTHPYPAPIPPSASTTQILANGEYGGVKYLLKDHTWSSGNWGYASVETAEEFDSTYNVYANKLAVAREKNGLSAAVYTQITDVEIEINGLMTYDRVVKTDIDKIYKANRLAIEGIGTEPRFLMTTADVEGQEWKYTTTRPATGWNKSGFDDSAWTKGKAGFGASGLANMTYGTTWKTSDIWLRKVLPLDITEEELNQLCMRIYYDENTEVYFNGKQVFSKTGYVTDYQTVALSADAKAALNRHGDNLIAIHTLQTSGGQYIDFGLIYDEPVRDRSNHYVINTNLNYSNSNELTFTVGYATDLKATQPEVTKTITTPPVVDGSFSPSSLATDFTGTALQQASNLCFDITTLTNGIDMSKPVKLFFTINTTTDAEGTGRINSLSYQNKVDGQKAVPFMAEGLDIPNAGGRITFSLIINQDQYNPARNLRYTDGALRWDSPKPCSPALQGYRIYGDEKLITTVDANSTAYSEVTEGVKYVIVADYGTATASATAPLRAVTVTPQTGDNTVRHFDASGFTIPMVFNMPQQQATIEFWFKPDALAANTPQMGPGFGEFIIYGTSSGQVGAGWNSSTSTRVLSGTNAIKAGQWSHIAVTVDGSKLALYINGILSKSLTATGYAGMPAMSQFTMGTADAPISGCIDEVRVWNTARTAGQVAADMKEPTANPLAAEGLMAYYQMDEIEVDGTTYLRDALGANHAPYLSANAQTAQTDNSFLTPGTPSVAIELAQTTCKQGDEIVPKAVVSNAVATWAWSVSDNSVAAIDGAVLSPAIVINKTGAQTITLTATTADGTTLTTTKDITVTAIDKPQPDFYFVDPNICVGKELACINQTTGDNVTYTWTMTGADDPAVHTANATAVYSTAGTYDVTLTATNAAGTTSVTKQIAVKPNGPAIAFDVEPRVITLGQPTFLKDLITDGPLTSETWRVGNALGATLIQGSSTSFCPTASGVYDVTLTAADANGENALTKPQTLMVCTKASGKGLKFQGKGETLSIEEPFGGAPKRFTIDFWLNPEQLDGAIDLQAASGNLKLRSDETGAVTVTLNGTRVSTSAKGLLIAGEWHHYTFIYGSARVRMYRDGTEIYAGVSALSLSEVGSIVLGSGGSTYATMDELSFFNENIGADSITAFANKPVNTEMSTLTTYYTFDQVSGNEVADATGNGHTGVLSSNVSSDALVASTGVFALNTQASAERVDVSADYLTNYKPAYRHTGENLVPALKKRYCALETETAESTWQGAIASAESMAGVMVDIRRGAIVAQTMVHGFAPVLSNAPLYETVTLPAGIYTFSVAVDSLVNAGRSYVAVHAGTELNLDEALAAATLNEASVTFSLFEETEVSLGLIYNLPAYGCASVSSFSLVREPYALAQADGKTIEAVKPVDAAGSDVRATATAGGFRLTGTGLATVYNANGQLILKSRINGTRTLALPKGIYIVGGTKVYVK